MNDYRMIPAATIDQTTGAAHYLRDNWGDYGYRIGYAGADEFICYHSDGSQFSFLIDRYGSHYENGKG